MTHSITLPVASPARLLQLSLRSRPLKRTFGIAVQDNHDIEPLLLSLCGYFSAAPDATGEIAVVRVLREALERYDTLTAGVHDPGMRTSIFVKCVYERLALAHNFRVSMDGGPLWYIGHPEPLHDFLHTMNPSTHTLGVHIHGIQIGESFAYMLIESQLSRSLWTTLLGTDLATPCVA